VRLCQRHGCISAVWGMRGSSMRDLPHKKFVILASMPAYLDNSAPSYAYPALMLPKCLQPALQCQMVHESS
jgi:hypothetical protein